MDNRMRRALVDLQRLQDGHEPSPDDLASAPLLNDWCLLGPYLAGVVTGHPVIADGDSCITSMVLALASDRTWARTVSRFYRLGRPSGASVQ